MPNFKIYKKSTLRSFYGSTINRYILQISRYFFEAYLNPLKMFVGATNGCSFMLGANKKLQKTSMQIFFDCNCRQISSKVYLAFGVKFSEKNIQT